MNVRLLTFHYTLRDAGGRVLDTSRGGEPMPFIEGTGQIIEGLEEPLRAMTAGEKRTVVVPPERAYGVREAELVQRGGGEAAPGPAASRKQIDAELATARAAMKASVEMSCAARSESTKDSGSGASGRENWAAAMAGFLDIGSPPPS